MPELQERICSQREQLVDSVRRQEDVSEPALSLEGVFCSLKKNGYVAWGHIQV